MYPGETLEPVLQEKFSRMFVAAVLVVARKEKQN